MTRRESWAMFKALQDFNSRLEALTMEVSGLRAVVNIQSRQLAEIHVQRFTFNTASNHQITRSGPSRRS